MNLAANYRPNVWWTVRAPALLTMLFPIGYSVCGLTARRGYSVNTLKSMALGMLQTLPTIMPTEPACFGSGLVTAASLLEIMTFYGLALDVRPNSFYTLTQAPPRQTIMTNYTADQLASFPWIVSCDTLRAEDLLPKFWSAAETLAVWRSEPIPADLLASLTQLVGEDSNESDWSDDLADQTLTDLFDLLQEWSPTGFGFGASEGDGACFGFWLTPEWCDALEVLGFGNDDPSGWAELVARLEADGLDSDNIEDAYQGRAEGWSEERAGADYAQQLAQDSWLPDGPGGVGWNRWPVNCIDWDAAWRELQTGDGYRLHDIGGGEWLVFRAV